MGKKTLQLRIVPVTERALVQRLRRVLAKDGERLVANRTPHAHWPANVGRYYILDGRNIMVDNDVDLAALGKELGALRPCDRLQEDV